MEGEPVPTISNPYPRSSTGNCRGHSDQPLPTKLGHADTQVIRFLPQITIRTSPHDMDLCSSCSTSSEALRKKGWDPESFLRHCESACTSPRMPRIASDCERMVLTQFPTESLYTSVFSHLFRLLLGFRLRPATVWGGQGQSKALNCQSLVDLPREGQKSHERNLRITEKF